MERGYIKIYRKILDSGLIQNPHAFQLFGYLLLTATYKPVSIDVRGEMIRLEPGQVLTGRKFLSEKLKTSEQCIRTAIKYLEKNGIITIKSTNRYSLISIINWHTYQTINNDTNQQNNQQLTSSQPAANQQLTTIKEFKNLRIKEINKLNTLSSEANNRSEQKQDELIPVEIFIELPVIGKDAGLHKVTMKDIEEWQELYPAIDIKQELRNMKGYFMGNPKKRKTRSGINKSIHHWLSGAQNKYRDKSYQQPKTFAELEEEREKKRKEDLIKRMNEKYGKKEN